ncbi:GNAT family N-acetyltransferase [Kitasatospora sp. NPDC094028]
MDIVPLVPVTTGRLVLRPFAAGDTEDLFAYQRLESVARYLYRKPYSREQCEDLVARRAACTSWGDDGDVLALAICRRDLPGVIGEVVLKVASAHARQAEIGWSLHPDHEGRGYATEAASALAALAFDTLAVHRLFARLDVENTGSARVCERLGMRREAHLVENDLNGDQWGSEYVYAALARDLKR